MENHHQHNFPLCLSQCPPSDLMNHLFTLHTAQDLTRSRVKVLLFDVVCEIFKKLKPVSFTFITQLSKCSSCASLVKYTEFQWVNFEKCKLIELFIIKRSRQFGDIWSSSKRISLIHAVYKEMGNGTALQSEGKDVELPLLAGYSSSYSSVKISHHFSCLTLWLLFPCFLFQGFFSLIMLCQNWVRKDRFDWLLSYEDVPPAQSHPSPHLISL